MKFEDLGLAAPVLKSLNKEGYTTPTPIQQQAIPPVLEGVDLLGIAQTGTGKTAAFALPILTRLATDNREPMRKGCRALVLSPTRELASQIAESFRVYGRFLGVRVAVIFGGVDIRKQVQTLSRGVDVIVATPGRLLDHVSQKTVDLSGTEVFVLDEADQMLDMGFVKPIRRIAGCLSRNRQNLFFSATMPGEIAGLADELLNKPVKVSVTPVAKTADRIEQRIVFVEKRKKRALLVELFGNTELERSLVFTRTKRGADRVASHLVGAGMGAAAIHGNKSQRQRERALDSFKSGRTRVLVATDIAARGIDIDGVTHVVNFDLPEIPEAYVHRIGRTARAGASGRAISFCDNEERGLLRAIEKLTRQSIPFEDRRGDKALEMDPLRGHEERDEVDDAGRTDRGRSARGRSSDNSRRQRRDDRGHGSLDRDRRPSHSDRRKTAAAVSEVGETSPSAHGTGQGNRNARFEPRAPRPTKAAGAQRPVDNGNRDGNGHRKAGGHRKPVAGRNAGGDRGAGTDHSARGGNAARKRRRRPEAKANANAPRPGATLG